MVWPFSYQRKKNDDDIWFAEDANELYDDLEALGNLPNFATDRIVMVLPRPVGTTLDTFGMAAPTTVGTISNSDGTAGPGHAAVSGAVSGNVGGWDVPATVTRRDWEPEFVARAECTVTITSARYWVGLFSADPTASATPAVHLAAFRYDTTPDTTAFWRCVTNDGGGSPTVSTTNVAFTASTSWVLRIRLSLTDVKFFINDVLVATHTTTLPGSTTGLGWWITVTTTNAAAKAIRFGRMMLGMK
jgi:hypothetical protein